MIRALLTALLFAVPPAGASAQNPTPPTPPPLEKGVVARGNGLTVKSEEVIPLLLERFAMSRDGRELLELLISARLIEEVARERKLTVPESEVSELWNRLDRETRAAGQPDGLAAELAARGMSGEEFRDFLRLTLLQERLTREALEVDDDVTVSGDQQQIWLHQEMQRRNLQQPPPPWPDGIAAKCGGFVITKEEYGRTLLGKLNPSDVSETCWHLLLLKGIEKRMPDLSSAARTTAVDKEIARRRGEAEAGADRQGITFERILEARGSSIEMLRRDPSVSIAALTRHWVDQVAGPEGLRAEYEENRDKYEGRHGKAAHVWILFLVASQYENELNPRTYDQAEAELEKLKGEITSLRGFSAASARLSEEPALRESKGELGWVTRDDPRSPEVVRETVFDFLGAGGKVPATGAMLGPTRLDTGVILTWISAVRPSPPWEEMSEHVHEELRRRFIDEVMPLRAVQRVLR